MSALTKISEHVYWMGPAPPDRPSVCAVVGDRSTVMLDAGSSKAHTREFLDALSAENARRPGAVVYTFPLGSRVRRGGARCAGHRLCVDG